MRELTRLYEQIPRSKCTPGCHKCCSDQIQFTPAEEQNMGGYSCDGHCSHLVDGLCSVYENRPFVCRLFGTGEDLKCEGCVPEKYLSSAETQQLISQYIMIKKKQETENA